LFEIILWIELLAKSLNIFADKHKSVMKTWTIFLSILLISGFSSCKKDEDKCEKGEGDRFEDVRYFENFQTFNLDIPGQIILTPDTFLKSSRIVILGQQNVINQIITSIDSGSVNVSFNQCFKNHDDIQFHIYTPFLQKLVTNTAARFKTTSAIYGKNFTMELNSGTTVDITCKVDSLTTFINSSSTLNITGYASRQMIYHKSSGSYSASNLISDSTIIDLSSSGFASVYSTGHLIADLSGAGLIEFSGEDTLNVTTNITGSGKINDLR